jgi:hypothetical protein
MPGHLAWPRLPARSTLAGSDQLGATTGTGRPLEIYWLVLSSAQPFYRREIMWGVFHGAAIEHRHRGRGRFFASEWVILARYRLSPCRP